MASELWKQLHDEKMAECLAAMRGEKAPSSLDREASHYLARGIRYNDGFARKLREDNTADFPPLIIRALNARDIMSNRIPTLGKEQQADDVPYCFWYPDVPSEDTLRELLRLYPSTKMRYQIGRACAAGGYTALYRELDLLPDVAIAEEARDSADKGQAIYEHIMTQPCRYTVMDDYNLSLHDDPQPGAYLNGDTCVRSILDTKQPILDEQKELNIYVGAPLLDIAEDWRVGFDGCRIEERHVDPVAIRLLHQPLPRDLPTVDKDLLIVMAAWSGDIDRYARLRRPQMVLAEIQCVVRGIYHNTFFAKWYSKQPDLPALEARCCYARFLMNNDISWATDSLPDDHLPEFIWFPTTAFAQTYAELARRKPSMVPHIARACIVADYKDLFDDLDPTPSADLWTAAQCSTNEHYLASVEQKAARMGINLMSDLHIKGRTYPSDDGWDPAYNVLFQEVDLYRPGASYAYSPRPAASLPGYLTLDHVGFEHAEDVGRPLGNSTVAEIFLHVSVSDASIRPPEEYSSRNLVEMYDEWQSCTDEERQSLGLYPPPPGSRGWHRQRAGRGGRGRGRGG